MRTASSRGTTSQINGRMRVKTTSPTWRTRDLGAALDYLGHELIGQTLGSRHVASLVAADQKHALRAQKHTRIRRPQQHRVRPADEHLFLDKHRFSLFHKHHTLYVSSLDSHKRQSCARHI